MAYLAVVGVLLNEAVRMVRTIEVTFPLPCFPRPMMDVMRAKYPVAGAVREPIVPIHVDVFDPRWKINRADWPIKRNPRKFALVSWLGRIGHRGGLSHNV